MALIVLEGSMALRPLRFAQGFRRWLRGDGRDAEPSELGLVVPTFLGIILMLAAGAFVFWMFLQIDIEVRYEPGAAIQGWFDA
jgi:hypothetical protein